MKASVIVPCHPRNRETLRRTLDSLEAAEGGREAEIVVVEDTEGRGPSWARNRGLCKATGEVVFFCDADDTVRHGFFSAPLAALERTGAEMCLFTYPGGPRLDTRTYDGADAVRARFLPAFFGYSFDDVRRWNAGGALGARREMGQVWRCAFRRRFLESRSIRFDEAITLFEDAAFLSECVAFARRVATIGDELYDYAPADTGNLADGWRSRRHWDYKFQSLAFRRRLAAKAGEEVWRWCEASCVLSALEMMRMWRMAGLSRAEYRADLARYLADDRVRAALGDFPISWTRHPLVAAAVSYLRRSSRK